MPLGTSRQYSVHFSSGPWRPAAGAPLVPTLGVIRNHVTVLRRILAAVGLGTAALASGADAPLLDPTPDRPEPFGYKVSWFAVQAHDSKLVVEALGLGGGTTANWSSGIKAAYRQPTGAERPRAFVSPPIGGWVFVVGSSLPYPDAGSSVEASKFKNPFYELLSRLSSRFHDVQFFGSYRVVGLTAWARAVKGNVQRVFAYADGEVYVNVGEQSSEERQLNFANLSGLTPAQATERIFDIAQQQEAEEDELASKGLPPTETLAHSQQSTRNPIPDEECVLELATLWSINPNEFPLEWSLGNGVVISLPKEFAQQ